MDGVLKKASSNYVQTRYEFGALHFRGQWRNGTTNSDFKTVPSYLPCFPMTPPSTQKPSEDLWELCAHTLNRFTDGCRKKPREAARYFCPRIFKISSPLTRA